MARAKTEAAEGPVLTYVGPGYFTGIPGRDLTAEDLAALGDADYQILYGNVTGPEELRVYSGEIPPLAEPGANPPQVPSGTADEETS
jgi:hypothetical protein